MRSIKAESEPCQVHLTTILSNPFLLTLDYLTYVLYVDVEKPCIAAMVTEDLAIGMKSSLQLPA